MNQPFLVSAGRCHELLHQAAEARTTITLDYRQGDKWVHRKSRLVGIDQRDELLLVDVDPGNASWAKCLDPGLNVSVSFRHGHHKCVFTTSVVDVAEPGETAGGRASCPPFKSRDERRLSETAGKWSSTANGTSFPGRPVLRLLRPDEMHELQRRLYFRTPVPPGRAIPVDLWIADREAARSAGAPQRGRMLDLSGGGVSLELPGDVRLSCRENDLLTCRFAAEPSRTPLEIPTRLRHTDRLPDGRTRIGLQFVGLDTSDEGRSTLQRIQRITARLRASA